MRCVEEVLADYVEKLEFHELPQSVIEKAKYHLLDTLGCILIGARTPSLDKIFSVIKTFGGAGSSTLIGRNFRSDCLNAVLFNGAASHVHEFDDLHITSAVHPAAVIIPAVFNLGEVLNSDGKEVILAITIGYEVAIRVGIALGKTHYHFWHTTATAGIFGASAACSKLLRLNSDSILYSFGNAGTQASGLWQFNLEGAMSKLLHVGRAAQGGMLSALLAERGFTGAKSILSGEKGFFKATSRDYNPEKLIEGLGASFKLLETSIKFYPSCGHTHAAIQAAEYLKNQEMFAPSEIHKVIVKTYSTALDITGIKNPVNPYQAKFSLSYCVAAALKDGKVGLQHFTGEMLADPVIKGLMSKIEVSVDHELDKVYPNEWPAQVIIILKNGRKLEKLAKCPKGGLENPLWKSRVINKFKNLASKILDGSRINEMISIVLNFEKVSNIADFANFLNGIILF